MGFKELERTGKRMFEKYPVVKRALKRVYQTASYAASEEKIRSKGELIRLTPEDGNEYFFGYYDKSPWDADDRFLICLKAKDTHRLPAPPEPAELMLFDTWNENAPLKIGTSHAWNVQQGCMAQWMGPDFRSRILYNDFRNGAFCSVVYNICDRKEERVYSLPVYDVAQDGTYALSLDFLRLHRMRPGYGYSNLPDLTEGLLCPDAYCIWKLDLITGEASGLVKYTDFLHFCHDQTMDKAEHKVNHLMISPDGSRFMVLHRWFDQGHKHSRLVTMNSDATEWYNLSDDVFVSHCFWKNDREILSFLRKKESGDHYYLLEDQSDFYRMLWPELDTDGHCSYSPDREWVITDTYPNRKRLASVYLCKEDEHSRKLATVFSPFRYDNDCRCDLHPRWNRAGTCVCIDSVHHGKRGMYAIPIPAKTARRSEYERIPRIIHCIWLGHGEKSAIVQQCINSWTTFLPDYEIREWTEENINLSDCPAYVQEAMEAGAFAFASDYLRLKALYEYGGIYLDTDLEVLRRLDRFLKLKGFLGAESKYTVSTALIAAEPHAEWIRELMKEYETGHFLLPDGKQNRLPNTKRVYRYLAQKYGYTSSEHTVRLEKDFYVYPTDVFSPINCFTGKAAYTGRSCTVHHYDNSWKKGSERIKKRILQAGTRIVGEEVRAGLVDMKTRWKQGAHD